MSFNLYLFLIFPIIQLSLAKIACKSEDNKNLDWYIVMKLPNNYSFVYLSSDSKNLQWQTSNFSLQSDRNMVAITLEQSYISSKNQPFYVYYNDDRPNVNSSSAGGHLKGVLNFDESTGYWLMHSVPNFPSEGKYVFNAPQSLYGQSLICVSVATTYLKSIAQQLMVMYSTVYSSNLPDTFTKDQELVNLLNDVMKNARRNKLKSNIIEFTTLNSFNLIHFAKSSVYNEDIYSGLIAPHLNGSLYVETWMNGRGNKLNSSCQLKYKVNNIKEINFQDKPFKSTSDHSKWAISQSKATPYVCMGDINRMKSQFKRGGGALCVTNLNAWNALNNSIKSYAKC